MNQKPEYCNPPSEEDLRAALSEMKKKVDISEDDLKKLYAVALRHARERYAFTLPVRDVMTTEVIAARHDTDLYEAARLLSEHKISGMPVINESRRVVGVVSEADILVFAGLKPDHTFKDILHTILGRSPTPDEKSGKTVGDIMSFPPLTGKADDPAGEVARILDGRRIKRLPVVDDDGRLIGIISRADIVRAIGMKL